MNDRFDPTETFANVKANGLSIGYSKRGSGPPLVLMHGGEADHSMFAVVGAHLAKHFTVIAYDQRDSGATRDVAPSPRAYGLAEAGDDAAALIEALGYARAHVFGTSLGGHIAQVLAARHPERIDRLVLGSTWMAGHGLAAANPAVAEQMTVWRTDIVRHAPDIASKFFSESYLRAHPERIEMFRGSRRTPEQNARRAHLLGVPYPIGPGEIKAPSLLIMGELDGLIPNAATRAVADFLVEPSVQVIPGVGHIASIEAPEALAQRVTAFLEA
ncbi:MAG: alpha/beta fold hydrolase [Comamonadaceae bacterium]|nr:MAG: alpha/beta fold hydrolase [Comamonadaceae bacterium]